MQYAQPEKRAVYRGTAGPNAPVIYIPDLPEHPFEIAGAMEGLAATVVTFPVRDWNDSLTPWPAPGLYRGDDDFKGEAQVTLAEFADDAIPSIEREEDLHPAKRAICGYSLGGLFSFYAFTHGGPFDAMGCLSGSVWYEGWLDHVRSLETDLRGKYAFFSIGSKEKRAMPPILRTVQDNMGQCAEMLRGLGCTVDFEVGPGDHMHHHLERFARGLGALDAWLGK